MSPVSSPSLTHDKGLPKHLEELDKSHLEGDLRHKQPGGVLPRTDREAKDLGSGGVSVQRVEPGSEDSSPTPGEGHWPCPP